MNYTVGGRVLLRPVEIKDDEYIVRWRNAERQAFFAQMVVTPDTHRDFVLNRRPHDLLWMAETHQGPVGMASLTVDTANATAEFGRLFVERRMRRQRLGTEIVFTILAFAFEVLRLRSVFLLVRTNNKEAQQLYNQMGWRTELDKLDVIRLTYSVTDWSMTGRQRLMQEFGVDLDTDTNVV